MMRKKHYKRINKVAIEINLSTFESWRTLTDEDLKELI